MIEDEMSRRNDSFWTAGDWSSFAYVDDRLLHYGDLDGEPVIDVLSWGSSGYPTNAFLVRSPRAALGLESRMELDSERLARLVAGIDVVIVSAFDAESYVVWELD